MRSASLWLWGALVLAGCASRPAAPEATPALATATAAAPANPAPAVPAPAVTVPKAAAPAAAAIAAPAPAPAVVDAATQQRFDEALRLLKSGQAAPAAQQLRALAQAHPQLAGVQANLGLALRAQKQWPEAVAALEQATQLNPTLAVAWRELGLTLRQAGQFAQSRAAYQRALALAPDDSTAHLNLGILLDLYLGEPAAALPHYERYQALQGGQRDAAVDKWVLDLKRRKPAVVAAGATPAKEKP